MSLALRFRSLCQLVLLVGVFIGIGSTACTDFSKCDDYDAHPGYFVSQGCTPDGLIFGKIATGCDLKEGDHFAMAVVPCGGGALCIGGACRVPDAGDPAQTDAAADGPSSSDAATDADAAEADAAEADAAEADAADAADGI